MIFYVPIAAPMTRALKKELRRRGMRRRTVGQLGELMQENLDQAKRHGTLRYRPEHLRLLRGVRENPEIVDVAVDVLRARLAADGLELPERYEGDRLPADPDYRRIGWTAFVNAVLMTVAITAAVVLIENVAVMTTVVVLISLVGAGVFVWALYRFEIPVDPDDVVPDGQPTGRTTKQA